MSDYGMFGRLDYIYGFGLGNILLLHNGLSFFSRKPIQKQPADDKANKQNVKMKEASEISELDGGSLSVEHFLIKNPVEAVLEDSEMGFAGHQ